MKKPGNKGRVKKFLKEVRQKDKEKSRAVPPDPKNSLKSKRLTPAQLEVEGGLESKRAGERTYPAERAFPVERQYPKRMYPEARQYPVRSEVQRFYPGGREYPSGRQYPDIQKHLSKKRLRRK
jgi:hypothetical protein